MASLWEKIKAYLSGWPIGKEKPEPEPKVDKQLVGGIHKFKESP